MPQPLSIILCRDRTQGSEQEALIAALTAALAQRPQCDVTLLTHLVDLSLDGPGVRLLRSISGPMVVLACLYPRAAFWLLDANGVRGERGRGAGDGGREPTDDEGKHPPPAARHLPPATDRTIWCLDLREHTEPEPYLAEIERIAAGLPDGVPRLRASRAAGRGEARIVDEATRHRWYPVIDFDRCTNCLECLNFCLFGVYSLDERDAVLVEQPDACRNGCPACSRVCPQGAIMFPQHNDPGIAGDPQAREATRDEALGLKEAHHPSSLTPHPSSDMDRLVDQVDQWDL